MDFKFGELKFMNLEQMQSVVLILVFVDFKFGEAWQPIQGLFSAVLILVFVDFKFGGQK